MNLQDMMNNISTLGTTIRRKAMEISNMAGNPAVKFADIEAAQKELDEMNGRMAAMQASYDTMKNAQAGMLETPKAAEAPKSRREIRKSNEYVQAFCYALKNGLNPKTAWGNERCRILYDAMSEGGGSPAGTDGGFLVPEDIDNSINELRRELNPLAPLFNEETVTAPTGWRVIDTAPTTGMPSVDELATISNNSDQPAFSKVTYTLTKYGMRLPISNELLNDEAAGLMAYISRWFAKKLVLTENGLLITTLKTLAASALTSGTITPDSAIKTILNKTLDPAISNSAIILTNQSGFDALDQLVDEMGRGLLQPDPTNATVMRMFGRNVVKVSDAQLPNTSSKAEFFIGDMKEFATIFRKEGFELASTDVGGDAWAKDLTEVRGIVRLGVSKFDADAVVRRQLTLS